MCKEIEAVGATTFRDDRDINGGDDVPEAIRQAILTCPEMIVLLTPRSIDRQWVLNEIGAGWLRGPDMRMVGVCHDLEMSAVPAVLSHRKAFDFNHFDDYLADLIRRIKGLR